MKRAGIRAAAALAIFAAVCALAYIVEPAAGPDGAAVVWYSVVPPLTAILMAFATGRLFPSLLSAGIVGGLLLDGATGAAYVPVTIAGSLTDTYNLQILFFVVAIMAVIEVIVKAGGLAGVVARLAPLCRGPYSTQFVTALLGVALFIDDYANTMIVGHAMRPVCDAHRVSREKLSFLVDATSAPIAGMALVSTWVSYEIGLFRDLSESLNLGLNGFEMLLMALPFRFYCILLLVLVFGSILLRRDFGPMAAAERRARILGKIAADDARPLADDREGAAAVAPGVRSRARTAVIPIGLLLLTLFGGIWIDGGGAALLSANAAALFSPYAWREVIATSENATFYLACGSAVGFAAGIAMALGVAGLGASSAVRAVGRGVKSALLPCSILLLAWTLKSACDDLGTADYMVALIGGNVPATAFPALVFVSAAVISFATGTSYGTMAIMLPTAIPVAYALSGGEIGFVLVASLAAVLDGAIFGDHCSPISDTTIMSSLSSHCDHMHHVRSQLPYSLLVAAVALTGGYALTGLGASHWLAIPAAAALLLGAHVVLARLWPGDRMEGGMC